MEIKKVIITGKTGLIARKLVESLELAENCSVLTTTSSGSTDEKCLFLDLNNSDAFDYEKLSAGDTVIHAAAVSSPDICNNDYEYAYRINVTETAKFIANCIDKGAKVLFFSTDVVYGNTIDAVDEMSETNPFGRYAKMKDEVEKKFIGEPLFKVFRLSYVLSNEDKYLSYLQHCANNSEVAEVFDPFERKVVAIDDVIDATVALIRNWDNWENSIINVCGAETVSRKDIADYYNHTNNGLLKYRTVEPEASFWDARPKDINMTSKYLEGLLGRKPLLIKEKINNIFAG